MPIALSCDCGRALKVKDELGGKKIRCPQCQSILAVPVNRKTTDDLILEVLPADDEDQMDARKTRRAAVQAEPPEVLPVRRRADEDDEEPRPRKRSKPSRDIKRRTPAVTFERGWFGSTNAGIAGGVLMMFIAVVWFILGIVLIDRIFIYPPILFVIGLIAIVKGGLGVD